MNIIHNIEALLPRLAKSLETARFTFDFSSFSFSVAAYFLMAIGLYTIAKKRNLQNPWLAFVPVANLWILGCISDQYHYVTNGQERKRRKSMLTLGIIEAVAGPVLIFLAVVFAIGVFGTVTSGSLTALGASAMMLVVLAVLLLMLCIGLLTVSIVLQVQRCYAFYDLFCSCETNNKTLYSVLAIVASCLGVTIVPAVLVFICREKEEGMPPRIVE